MSALTWVRNKAQQVNVSEMIIESSEAGEGTKPGKWKVTLTKFSGVLPFKMAQTIRAELNQLVKIYSGDTQVNETLRIGGEYRSQFGNCEYMKTVYEYIGA